MVTVKNYTIKKRVILVFVMVCLVFIAGRMYGEKNNAKDDAIEYSNTHISGATQDYIDAYHLFCNANVTDNGEYTYSKAIEAFTKVSQTTKSAEVKLRCLLFISLSSFLDGKTEDAYTTGLEALSIAKTVLKDNANLALLEKIKSAIEARTITKISDVVISAIGLGDEVSGLMMDLYFLHSNRNEYQDLVKECWGKFQKKFDQELSSLAQKYTISFQTTAKIKKELEERYSRQGYFLHDEIEKEFIKLTAN